MHRPDFLAGLSNRALIKLGIIVGGGIIALFIGALLLAHTRCEPSRAERQQMRLQVLEELAGIEEELLRADGGADAGELRELREMKQALEEAAAPSE